MNVPTSLRERSKIKRRRSIQRAGMLLFAERGYDGATIADIAREADVAPRTVSMYFASKRDLALSFADDAAARLAAIFEKSPGLTFTEAVDQWLSTEAAVTDHDVAALTSAMYCANPTLRSGFADRLEGLRKWSEPALLAELNLEIDDPMRPIIVAAVTTLITEYFATVTHTQEATGVHPRFMRYLRTMMATARRP